MAELIKSTLDKLLVESPSKLHDLREAITAAQEALNLDIQARQKIDKGTLETVNKENSVSEHDQTVNPTISSNDQQEKQESPRIQSPGLAPINADPYWAPFEIALRISSPINVREAALSGIQKLFAHKILRGAIPIQHSSKKFESVSTMNAFNILDTSSPITPQPTELPKTLPKDPTSVASEEDRELHIQYPSDTFLIDDIIHSICSCFTFTPAESNLHLSVLKTLLSAITSTSCEIHDISLLKVIQTCFNIGIHSKNEICSGAARGVLTQSVNLTFSRMENYAQVLAHGDADSIMNGPTPEDTLAPNQIPPDEFSTSPPVSGDSTTTTTTPSKSEFRSAPSSPVKLDTPKIEIQSFTEPNQLSPSARPFKIKEMYDDDEEGAATPPQARLRGDKLELITGASEDEKNFSGHNPYDPTVSYYNEILRKDVYLVFRLLCRLSIFGDGKSHEAISLPGKDGSFKFEFSSLLSSGSSSTTPTTTTTNPKDELSPILIKSRTLALELILSVLSNCGPVFSSDELFIGLVRKNLTHSISRNGPSTNYTLFELSLSILLLMLHIYRAYLKNEIEILLNTMYLSILEMGNSTQEQKSMLLEGLQKIVENKYIVADLYLNYDCDMSSASIFERIVKILAGMAQGRLKIANSSNLGWGLLSNSSTEQKANINKKKLRLLALKGLVSLVKSVSEWSAQGRFPAIENGPDSNKTTSYVGKDTKISASKSLDGENDGGGTGIGGRISMDSRHGAGTVTGTGPNDTPPPPPPPPTTTTTTITTSSSSPNKTFLEFMNALAPNSQVPIFVYKNPLHAVSISNVTSLSVQTTVAGSTSSIQGANEGDTSSFEEIATRKQVLRDAIATFNIKPSKSIKILALAGFLEADDPVSIAKFLRTTPGLKKSAIGDYLGEGDPFNISVMHAFIDSMEFEGLDFIKALRLFLQTFRLPGEAQKISRIMEKFADRYCETNEDIFAKADTAYTLAYSVLMLNTDQHSSQIKNRMDKAAFIKNNRGINDSADLPDEYLGAIFDEIHDNEIIMEEEHAGSLAKMAMGWAGDVDEEQRKELYKMEVTALQKKSAAFLKAAGGSRGTISFRTAINPDLGRPMLTVGWPAFLATFSIVFEGTSEIPNEMNGVAAVGNSSGWTKEEMSMLGDLCMEGFKECIKISGIFRMETERDAFVTGLAKLTSLNHMQDIRSKNIKAIKTMINLAGSLGEVLDSSWQDVLQCVSQMERLQLIIDRSAFQSTEQSGYGRENSGINGDSPTSIRNDDINWLRNRKSGDFDTAARNPALERLMYEFQTQTGLIMIDRIYSNTIYLSGSAIVYFFKALCSVSAQEVGLDSSSFAKSQSQPSSQQQPQQQQQQYPRMYSLQKIVEIAYYNMNRIRYEWSQIWKILQPYFNAVGTHSSITVSSFAVDALRQLSMKFLERDELAHYHAQNEFLKSFEWIMKYNSATAIRDLILQSLSQMITARARNIRSGWKSIFVTLSRAATHRGGDSNNRKSLDNTNPQSGSLDDRLVTNSFAIVQLIYKEYFQVVIAAGSFVDFVSCLAEISLSGTNNNEVVMGCIKLLQVCARHLSLEHPDPIYEEEDGQLKKDSVKGTLSDSSKNFSKSSILHPHSDDHFFLKWFPILSALSRVVIDCEWASIRCKALDTLFDSIQMVSRIFDSKCWKIIYRSVILPIFEDLTDVEAMDTIQTPRATRKPRQREANSVIWIQALSRLVDIVTSSLSTLHHLDIATGLYHLIDLMLRSKDEKLASAGQICLHRFLRSNMTQFEKFGMWDTMVDIVENAFNVTLPTELVNWEYHKEPLSVRDTTLKSSPIPSPLSVDSSPSKHLSKLDFDHTIIKCSIHIELLQGIRDLSLSTHMVTNEHEDTTIITATDENDHDNDHSSPALVNSSNELSPSSSASEIPGILLIPISLRNRWLNCIFKSYQFAKSFNANYDLRYAIWKRGLIQQMPNLIKQETTALSTYIHLLFLLYRVYGDDYTGEVGWFNDHQENSPQLMTTKKGMSPLQQALITELTSILERFINFLPEPQKNQPDIALWSPVIVTVFQELLQLDGFWEKKESMTSVTLNNMESSLELTSPHLLKKEETKRPKYTVLRNHIAEFFMLSIRMMSVDRAEVRHILQQFMEKVAGILVQVLGNI